VKATTYVRVALVLVIAGISSIGRAQTNSWISPTRGYWDDYSKWLLNVAPSNSQSAYITNDVSKTVTIDSFTSGVYPGTMTVSNLFLSAPVGVTNALDLSDAGTNVPLRILDTFGISSGGLLSLANAALSMSVMTNANVLNISITNSFLTVDGVVVLNSNGFLMADSGIYAGVETNATGVVLLNGGQLFLTNTSPSAIGVNGVGQLIVSNGQVQAASSFIFVGAGKGSQGTLTLAGGNYVASPVARLVVGMETGAVGVVTVSSGNLIMTNSFITLVGCDGSGQLNLLGGTNLLSQMEVGGDAGSQGTLTVAAGVNTFQAGLSIGASIGATGVVWMTGGQVIATNLSTCVASWGNGLITVSNGNWLGGSMTVGIYSNGLGTVNVNGGTITLLTKLVLGNCPTGGMGVVNVAGGSLYVTNAVHNAFIDVRNGQLNLNGGLLRTDKLVMTNSCGLFSNGGGTLIVGSLVLDPKLSALGDGIPNGWKQQYGFNPLDPTVASADPDGDGMSNLQEYLAGTDPTNSASRFQIISIAATGSDMLISWSVVTGKTYTVQLGTNTIDGSYMNVFSNLATVAVPAAPAITGTNYLDVGGVTNGASRFYRIQLVLPP